ncbi:MAG: hypothetical protein K0B16_06110, partial [Burkholderiaceae bacterium]|nr:hypothetical protein [Burkholderiaceae bacterium]
EIRQERHAHQVSEASGLDLFRPRLLLHKTAPYRIKRYGAVLLWDKLIGQCEACAAPPFPDLGPAIPSSSAGQAQVRADGGPGQEPADALTIAL